jgi:hypothetical protein
VRGVETGVIVSEQGFAITSLKDSLTRDDSHDHEGTPIEVGAPTAARAVPNWEAALCEACADRARAIVANHRRGYEDERDRQRFRKLNQEILVPGAAAMTTKRQQSKSEPLLPRERREVGKIHYAKPSLIVRERLSRITAEDAKTSGISSDSVPSDIRLKEDIRLVGRTFDGLNVYVFRYKTGAIFHMGVLAQEVLAVRPQAVREIGGYLAVDYSQIGVGSIAPRHSETASATYHKPTLIARERLSQIAAADSKTSGVTVSDQRRKDDIRLVGRTFDGLSVYTFRYKDKAQFHMGVLAQEAQLVCPQAVSETEDGYLAVDYARIGTFAAR